MPVIVDEPTPYPEVNAVLYELVQGVQALLGSRFVGMYLDGSLASGDFDQESDIDFVVVTDVEISDDLLPALEAMHERIAAIDSLWANQLEGSYLSQQALRRYDPAHARHPNIEGGRGERLKMVHHGEGWITHRHILREHGITLTGPVPPTLIDPVSPRQLRHAMRSVLSGEAAQVLREPAQMEDPGFQSYMVITLCRVLYTLQNATIVSKPVAARWAQATLAERWVPVIERARTARHHPASGVSSEDVTSTLEFIRYAQDCCQQIEILADEEEVSNRYERDGCSRE